MVMIEEAIFNREYFFMIKVNVSRSILQKEGSVKKGC